MERLLEAEKPYEALQPPIRAVAYYGHVFANNLDEQFEQAKSDVEDMIDHGFNHIVLCVTERDTEEPERLYYLSRFIGYSHENNLAVLVDPWALANIFGGEGDSKFRQEPGDPIRTGSESNCGCNPNVLHTVDTWIDIVSKLGADGIFWDEPELKHLNENEKRVPCVSFTEFEFIKRLVQRGHDKNMPSVVCLTADEKHIAEQRQLLKDVAKLPGMKAICTDPYYPNAFNKRIPRWRSRAYVGRWTDYTREAAEEADIEPIIWLQAFGLKKGYENQPNKFARVAQSHGVGNIAVWAYNACQDHLGLNDQGGDPKKAWANCRFGSLAKRPADLIYY